MSPGRNVRQGGLAQTSPFEVCDAPQGQSKVRRSAPGSLPDRSLREIADSTERSLRQPAIAACGTEGTRTTNSVVPATLLQGSRDKAARGA
jgi:hypothetical protein